jgi:amidohydrolase
MSEIDKDIFGRMVDIRRDLHRHPELSWHEERTAEVVCQILDECGIRYRRGLAKTGVVAELPGEIDGPVVALRADMDALPIQEETGLPFASQAAEVMHACGHDGHTSMLLGAAMQLVSESALPAPVRLIFQPAEETGLGAKAMIEDGALEHVAMIFGGHLDRHYPAGSVVVTDGAVNASSDAFHIDINGRGGHAARPHETIDAVVVGSLLVTAIQTIVSREVNPAHPSVISVGRFVAGSASNVIANRAELSGSIRAQDPEVRTHLKKSLRRIAASIGQLHGATVDIDISDGTPPLINKPPGTQIARAAATEAVGADQVKQLTIANMGGEDFSYYLEHVPGCYVRFGSEMAGRDNYPAHSSKFDFDERALAAGAAYYRAVALAAGQRIRQT